MLSPLFQSILSPYGNVPGTTHLKIAFGPDHNQYVNAYVMLCQSINHSLRTDTSVATFLTRSSNSMSRNRIKCVRWFWNTYPTNFSVNYVANCAAHSQLLDNVSCRPGYGWVLKIFSNRLSSNKLYTYLYFSNIFIRYYKYAVVLSNWV